MSYPFSAPVDLRSDTVTKPTEGMRRAMAAAEVGDDVYDEDPTVHRLQERVAELLGKEAALYVPSGTMSNQIAVRVHTQPGDEILVEASCHIYNYEAGGPAVLSHVMCRPIPGRYGVLDVDDFEGMIRPTNEHYAQTRLVCLENTHNRGGGRIFPLANIERICAWAHEHGLRTHLDGARLFNAVVATGVAACEYARHFDTVSVCFSKGLGAPVGSALAGPRELIARARRIRKVFGGGMRQAGVIAAAALYALEHHIERLHEDHENAQRLARVIDEIDGLVLDPPDVHTNIIWFEVHPTVATAAEVAERARQRHVLLGVGGPQTLRACTHLDVTREMIDYAGQVLREVMAELAATRAKVRG